VMTRLIERNTTIPTKKTEVFSTASDSQTQVEIHVLQGERDMAHDNRTLGRFHLVGIPPAPRGVPQIEVTFDIDANGILNVSAKDTATGKTQAITITSSSGLSKDEVDRMVKEAGSHASEDKQRRELVEARNEAESLAYNVEKLIKENREKLAEADVKAVEEAVATTRKAAEAEDLSAIRGAVEKLKTASHKLAETLYRKAAPPPPDNTGPGGAQAAGAKPGDDNVVDAEYTVKN
jgi:molecular chaperone DnaK